MIRQSLRNRENWEQLAVIENGQHITYGQLARQAAAIEQRLPEEQQAKVAVFLPNGGAYLAAFYAVLMAGQTVFPMNVKLTVHEVTPLLRQAGVQAVITSRAYQELFEEAKRSVSMEVIYQEELPELGEGTLPWVKEVSPEEPMLMLTTSGTTGSAKIVQLSERNVDSSTFSYINKMDYGKYEPGVIRYTLGTPFFSVYGILVLTVCILNSFPIVVLGDGFTLETLYQKAQAHRITHYEGGVLVGQWMEQMIGRDTGYDISSLRYLGLAGSGISAETLRRLTEGYPGVEFWPGYGMTEAGPLIAKPDKRVNMEKLASVGTGIPCLALMVEAEGRLTDQPHLRGEIVVKGPNVMMGYYENPEETRKVLRDGYLYTGDIGYLDEDGYLYLCGRKKNVIITRGFNVYPEEVEDCLLGSGLVKDCVVYGETDELAGEMVCGDIVPMNPELSTEAVAAYCREHLTDYKRPLKLRVVEAIKKTATGKTERA